MASSGSSDALPSMKMITSGPPPLQVLKDKRDRMAKAVALAEKMQKTVSALPTCSMKVSTELSTLLDSLEQAELLQHEMTFMVKFGKDMRGSTVTAESAATVAGKGEELALSLIEGMKVPHFFLIYKYGPN